MPLTTARPLMRDSAFGGMLATQFLGAFNDNLYKQLVLLICVDRVRAGEPDRQWIALVLFALPFVLYSGFAGFLSDRFSKRTIVVWMKVAEIAVMLAGLFAFRGDSLWFLFAVLFLMSAQSTFFGPSKYGILPELFAERDLPLANGLIQMTTFVAIIFGMALAGYSKEWFAGRLWMASLFCVGIATIGTLTSLLVRRTAVADPAVRFHLSSAFLDPASRTFLRGNPRLLKVLMYNSSFWFLGGVVQPAVNAYGKLQLGIGDGRTSVLGACMGVGIALGCLWCGKLSGGRPRTGFVRIGALGMAACFAALVVLGETSLPVDTVERISWLVLTLLGMFGGFFIVPLNVLIQVLAPDDQKGRMIGAMNLFNWLLIIAAGLFYWLALKVVPQVEPSIPAAGEASVPQASWIFAALLVAAAWIAVVFRIPDQQERPPALAP